MEEARFLFKKSSKSEKQVDGYSYGRACGYISVSCAFGDMWFKTKKNAMLQKGVAEGKREGERSENKQVWVSLRGMASTESSHPLSLTINQFNVDRDGHRFFNLITLQDIYVNCFPLDYLLWV